MDERLEKALEHSNYSITIANQKKNLKNRFQQQLLVHHQGGAFCADPQTINFTAELHRQASRFSPLDMSAVILDTKENPIKVSDISELNEKLHKAYYTAVTEYEEEFSKIKRLRKLDKLLEQ